MEDRITIWSRKPVHQKKTTLDMLEATYESCYLQVYFYEREEYEKEGTIDRLQKEVQIIAKHKTLYLYLTKYQEQQFGEEKWSNQRFVKKGKVEIIEPELYKLAVSKNFISEITFHFAYHYLKINQDQFIDITGFYIDWETIKEAYPKGYSEDWSSM